MATVRNNTLTEGLSGRVGGLVFKNYGSTTVVTVRPRPPKMQSVQQKENLSKFREATLWAKAILLDAARKAYYQKKAEELNLPNAYTAAITDYMRKPKLQSKLSSVLQLKDATNTITYEISKKGFALKSVAMIIRGVDGVSIATRAVVKDRGGAWIIDMNEAERLNDIAVKVMDEAGRMYVIAIRVKG